jgi:Hypervirulence associated proteins TUDOR domain
VSMDGCGVCLATVGNELARRFKVGDHVSWNSEAGRVRGRITQKITSPMRFKTYMVRASKEEPQYLIKSDQTDHLAMHKGAALKKVKKYGASRNRSMPRTPK